MSAVRVPDARRGLAEPVPWDVGRPEPNRVVLAVLALCVALTPLVSPKGPGNGAPIDVFVAVGVATTLLWAIHQRAWLRFPYFGPMTAYVIAGLVAALLSAVPLRGGIAAAQEVFLFLWCAAITTLCRTPRALGVVLRAWAISVTVWAGVLVGSVLGGLTAISGAALGQRAQLFFDHPNMAGNYFMIGIFVVIAAGYPRRRWLRAVVCLLLLTAMFFTGSNAALLSLVGGVVVTAFLHLNATRGLMPAIAVVTVVAAGLTTVWVSVVPALVTAAEQSENPLLRYTVGRSPESADKREDLFADQLRLFEQGHLLGVGPAAVKHELGTGFARLDKEAHNDYLATLVERGPIGLLAVVALMAAIGVRVVGAARGAVRNRSPGPLQRALPVPAALGGACAAFALTALTHEVLHYRWFWALMGLLAAAHLLTQADREERVEAR